MASSPYVETLLGGLPADLKKALADVFRYVLGNLRVGRPGEATVTVPTAAENLRAAFYTVTTPSVANTEFTIPHGLSTAPYLLMPVLPLNVVGAQTVPLTVSQVADASRVYLKSSSTSAPIYVLIEG